MTIKFYCDNHCADFTKTEEQLIEQGQGFTHCAFYCAFCGEKLHIQNLDEIVKLDIEKRAEEYLTKGFNEIGIEATVELVERNKDQATYKIYKQILQKKGLMR